MYECDNNKNSPTQSRQFIRIFSLFFDISNKSQGLNKLEQQFMELAAQSSSPYLIKKLIDLLESLDVAKTVEINVASVLEEIIENVIILLSCLGAKEIEAQAGMIFNPFAHRAIGVEYCPELEEGTIVSVVRRGFDCIGKTHYAEVVVSTRKESQSFPEMNLGVLCDKKEVILSFDGGEVSNDSGVFILKGIDEEIGLVKKIAGVIDDKRDARYISHELEDLLAQRIYQISMGYEDANDCNSLRNDLAFKTVLRNDGAAAASQPTMSRLENSITQEEILRIRQVFLENFVRSYKQEPKIVVLDFDTTDDSTHGDQQMTFFNAYYDEFCFLPMHVYEGLTGKFVTAILRPGKTPKGSEIVEMLVPIVEYLRKCWPNTILVFRGDSHFASPVVLDYLENVGLLYTIGTASSSNGALKKQAFLIREEAQEIYRLTKNKAKRFASFEYQATSWSKPRRVIIKAEYSELGENTRSIVTNIEGKASQIYDVYFSSEDVEIQERQSVCRRIFEDIYCARGNCENYIKDHKTYLKSDRTSCTSFVANDFRLLLHSAAYVLLHTMKTGYLNRSIFSNSTFQTIQLRILKVAARVRIGKTRIRFSLPSSYPLKNLWSNLIECLYPLRC